MLDLTQKHLTLEQARHEYEVAFRAVNLAVDAQGLQIQLLPSTANIIHQLIETTREFADSLRPGTVFLKPLGAPVSDDFVLANFYDNLALLAKATAAAIRWRDLDRAARLRNRNEPV